jgi:hypothetical protein
LSPGDLVAEVSNPGALFIRKFQRERPFEAGLEIGENLIVNRHAASRFSPVRRPPFVSAGAVSILWQRGILRSLVARRPLRCCGGAVSFC